MLFSSSQHCWMMKMRKRTQTTSIHLIIYTTLNTSNPRKNLQNLFWSQERTALRTLSSTGNRYAHSDVSLVPLWWDTLSYKLYQLKNHHCRLHCSTKLIFTIIYEFNFNFITLVFSLFIFNNILVLNPNLKIHIAIYIFHIHH